MPAPYSLFLDDTRRPPGDGDAWVLCRTVDQLISTVKDRGIPRHASFDFELDKTESTHDGLSALGAFIETLLAGKSEKFQGAVKIRLHTSSDDGKRQMKALMKKRRAKCADAGIDLIDYDDEYYRMIGVKAQ